MVGAGVSESLQGNIGIEKNLSILIDCDHMLLFRDHAMTLIEHFKEHLHSIKDIAKVTYSLFEVLLGFLCAVIAGAKGWALVPLRVGE